MTQTVLIQGRRIGSSELAQVRTLLAAHPDWSRYRLSRQLALMWDWRNPVGQLKDMASRTLLLKLQRRGLIELPECRRPSPNRMRHKQMPVLEAAQPAAPITGPLADLLPLTIRELSQNPDSAQRALFDALLHRYHYLSHRSPVGENAQYLVCDTLGRPVACALFGAAAWQCRVRDEFIGWDAPTRQRALSSITNNTRLLILPWVRVPHLASHLLGCLMRRLSADWQRKYGHPIHLVETFVDTGRFAGTCYRAANWREVGRTTGRTRQNKTLTPQAAPKAVWLYPLRKDFRRALTVP